MLLLHYRLCGEATIARTSGINSYKPANFQDQIQVQYDELVNSITRNLPPIETTATNTLNAFETILPLLHNNSPLVPTAREILEALIPDPHLSADAIMLCQTHTWCTDRLKEKLRFDYPPLQLAWIRYWEAHTDKDQRPQYVKTVRTKFASEKEILMDISESFISDAWEITSLLFGTLLVNGYERMVYSFEDEIGWFVEDRFMRATMQEIRIEFQSEENTETTYWVEVEGKHYVFDEGWGGYLMYE